LELAKEVYEINPSSLPLIFMYRPVPATKLYMKEAEEGKLSVVKGIESWSQILSRQKNNAVERGQRWPKSKALREGYRARNGVRKIVFYYQLANMKNMYKGLDRIKILSLFFQKLAQLRYGFKIYQAPVEWYIYSFIRNLKEKVACNES
jgi:hypothetical protein